MMFQYPDLKGILYIDGNMIFLPWVCSIVPYSQKYTTPIDDPENKCVVTFHNKQELLLKVPARKVFEEIKGSC